MRQFSRTARPVKRTRTTPKPAAPFGAGLLCRTKADEDWLAMHSFDPNEPTDAQWEAMALQAAWDAMWEGSEFGPEKCACCGDDAEGELTAGLCDECALLLDRDGSLEVAGGTCPGCRCFSDFIEPSGYCPSCDLKLSDMSASGNQGY